MLSLILALLAQDPVVKPEGARLADQAACYTLTMTRGDQSRPIGLTWQTIERVPHEGGVALKVVVHQSVGGGSLDMRDEFLLDPATLRPLSLVNVRNGETHVQVRYLDDRIVGERREGGVVAPIDVPLTGPVWDGNLFGLTFAALPLAEGAAFSLPYWQYDKGFGRFTVRVTGTETVATPDGPVEAWVLDAGADEASRLTYLVARGDNRELGYRAGPGAQALGGDCAALSAAS